MKANDNDAREREREHSWWAGCEDACVFLLPCSQKPLKGILESGPISTTASSASSVDRIRRIAGERAAAAPGVRAAKLENKEEAKKTENKICERNSAKSTRWRHSYANLMHRAFSAPTMLLEIAFAVWVE